MPDYNILCQLTSYFSHYFNMISNFSMLAADYILIWILHSAKYFPNDLVHSKPLSNSNHPKKRCSFKCKNLPTKLNKPFVNINKKLNTKNKTDMNFFKNSLCLIDTFRKRKFDLYAKITNQEGFHIILILIVCLYSLSFILWTHGVNEREHTVIQNTENEFAESISVSKMCNTFGFAKKFMSIFSIIFSIFRLTCLVLNFSISVIYHIKFRDHVRKIFAGITKIDRNQALKQKRYNLRVFNLFYFTKCIRLKDKQSTIESKSNESSQNETTYKLHSMHLVFVQFYALFSLVYSFLVLPVEINKFLDSINLFKKFILKNTLSTHISIPNFNASIEFAESDFETLIFEENNQTEDMNLTAMFMNNFFHLSPEIASNYDFMANLSQKLAYMIKLPIFIFYLVHVNILLEFKR